MNKFAQEQGLPGMGYIFWRLNDENKIEAAGPIAKNMGNQKKTLDQLKVKLRFLPIVFNIYQNTLNKTEKILILNVH